MLFRAASGGEGKKEVETVLGGDGQVTADGAELGGAGEGAQAAGYFLPQLDHPGVNASFGILRTLSTAPR
jgi:hypothetical protein